MHGPCTFPLNGHRQQSSTRYSRHSRTARAFKLFGQRKLWIVVNSPLHQVRVQMRILAGR